MTAIWNFARPVGSVAGASPSTALDSAAMNASSGRFLPCSSSSTVRGLAQERKGLGGKFEPDHVRTCLGGWRVVRTIAGAMIGDEIFDLAQVLVGRSRNPGRLGRGRCHARQLAHCGERKFAAGKRSGELRQGAERTRDPQPVLGGARGVAEHALEVVQGGYHAEGAPDLQRLGLTKPTRFVGIERGAAN